jgi:hypothetical protein
MKLSEIERIAKVAMDACSEVISHPKDSFVRQQLFDSLTEVVDPAFLETDQSRRDSFNRLLQQANVRRPQPQGRRSRPRRMFRTATAGAHCSLS